ncbi:glycosyltransferase, partial [Georgenia sp. 10Sc9-8]|nr:glycosyltransferase [Georgenia halotolerans]
MADSPRTARPATLAVVVSAGVSTYLPRTLAGIAGQRHVPEAVLVVDVGAAGRDLGTGVPVHQAVTDSGLDARVPVRVVGAPEAATFGEAVRLGLEKYVALLARAERRGRGQDGGTGPRTLGAVSTGWRTGEMSPVSSGELRTVDPEGLGDGAAWLWLLHDDSAPDVEALDRLLHAAESGPSVAVAGAKQRGWAMPDRLLQVGLRATRSGRRVADIEPEEIDQGQHDDRDDVLAVGLAGALVRRDVWAELGGTDPVLGPFGDGLDLCRRARLAGYRVVVVPTAWVHHARASHLGLRGTAAVDEADQVPDPRRSFRARRTAQLYHWLTFAPTAALPLIVLWLVLLGPLRALARVAVKELSLAGAELAAVATVLSRGAEVRRARREVRRTRRVRPRELRPLEATGREVYRAARDRRRQQRAARRAAEAPSELEIAERAALARRRRTGLTVVLLLLSVLALVVLAPLLTAGTLTGGALLPADATASELWRAARSGWVPAGLGHPGPADPLWTVLAAPMTVLGPLGVSTNALVIALVVLAVPLAGASAWFAAGAATRSVLLRAWVAVVWALAPALLLGAGQGRLGALLAHLALPWVALGVARAVGVQRRDIIESGLVGAERVAVLEPAEPVGTAAGDPPTTGESADHAPASLPAAAVPGESAPAVAAARRAGTGSPAAAAGAGLALAVASAGAPVLLPVSLVLLLVVAAVVPRWRLVLVALPALALLGPVLTAVLAEPDTWRALLADPGAPFATAAPPAWQQLLGWPVPAAAAAVGPASWLPVAGGAVVVVAAALALLRGGGRAGAVRVGWVVALVGLVVAVAGARLAVGVGSGVTGQSDQLVRAWTGTALSLLTLGLLMAVAVAGDGLRARLGTGWLRVTAVVVGALMVAGPLLTAAHWVAGVREPDPAHELLALHGRPDSPVPALAAELQRGPQRARVLALTATQDGVHAEVWRDGGPQLSTTSTLVRARDLTGPPTDPQVTDLDPAETALAGSVAALSSGAATDAGTVLGEAAVGVVVVPPVSDDEDGVTGPAREALVSRLDATAG